MKDISALRTDKEVPDCCHNNLRNLLIETVDFLNKYEIVHWVDYGTLLGIIRDGDILKWDQDVDLSITSLEYQKLLDAVLEDKKRKATTEGPNPGLILNTHDLRFVATGGTDYFTTSGVSFPRFYYSETNSLYLDLYLYDYNKAGGFYHMVNHPMSNGVLYKAHPDYFNTLDTIKWKGKDLKVPSHPKEYLKTRYGIHWAEPDPFFYQKYPPNSEAYHNIISLT